MISIWVCCVGIFGITVALPVNHLNEDVLELLSQTDEFARNSILENLLIDVLEDLRQIMVTGNDDIPVLDPFYLDHVFVDESTIPIAGAHIELNDLTISKLSTFELNSVSITSTSVLLQRYSVEVEAEVPVIEVDVGKYDLFGSVDGMSIFGSGDARLLIVKPKLKVKLLVGIRLGLAALYLNILETRIEISLADFQPAINGMFNNPSLDGFVNLFLKNLVLDLLDSFSEEITDTLSPLVQTLANDVLSDLNLISILG